MMSSSIAVLRAAVISFQCLCFQYPDVIGVLVGQTADKQKRKLVAHSVIAGNSIDSILSHDSMRDVCSMQGLTVCGVMFLGDPAVEADHSKAQSCLVSLLKNGLKIAMCVLVPRLGDPKFVVVAHVRIYRMIF